MAISKEDYHDVKGAMGKALAKKVKTATHDKPKREPVQVSREWYKGKRQMVGFYESKNGNITMKPHKG